MMAGQEGAWVHLECRSPYEPTPHPTPSQGCLEPVGLHDLSLSWELFQNDISTLNKCGQREWVRLVAVTRCASARPRGEGKGLQPFSSGRPCHSSEPMCHAHKASKLDSGYSGQLIYSANYSTLAPENSPAGWNVWPSVTLFPQQMPPSCVFPSAPRGHLSRWQAGCSWGRALGIPTLCDLIPSRNSLMPGQPLEVILRVPERIENSSMSRVRSVSGCRWPWGPPSRYP